MNICPNCGRINREGTHFCVACGSPIKDITQLLLPEVQPEQPPGLSPPVKTRSCLRCNTPNSPTALFCSKCGHEFITPGPLSSGSLLQNRYRIERILGQGGQSIVYLARDEALDRAVAVKELVTAHLPRDGQISAGRRFQREATILAALRHPNLTAVYDFFSTNKGEYLVMEYIDGETLDKRLASVGKPFGEDQVLNWALVLCDVISYLHSQSVIFRDMKPGNIMVDRAGVLRLIDFNVAHIFREERERDLTTEPGGTPGWASPEQFFGVSTDIRTDIFGLGATLYSLLTGRGVGMEEYKRTGGPPRMRHLNPNVSEATEAVIRKALNAQLYDRYQSAAEMRDAFLALRGGRLIDRHADYPAWEAALIAALARDGRVASTDLSVPVALRPSLIEKYAERHPTQSLDVATDATAIRLSDFSRWQTLRDRWTAARDMLGAGDRLRQAGQALRLSRNDDAAALVPALARLLEFDPVDEPVSRGRLSVSRLAAGTLLAELPNAERLPVAVLRAAELTEADLDDLRALLGPTRGALSLAVLVLFLEGERLAEAVRLLERKMRAVFAYDIVPLAHDELFQIATARQPRAALRSLVLSRVDLRAISPFVTKGPVSDDRFFGREQELRNIAEHIGRSSFVVTGGRRFGKSSLLTLLHRARLPAAGFHAIYYDCSPTRTYEDFLAADIVNWQPAPPPNAPATFGDLLRQPPAGAAIVLLLDEADKLVSPDRANEWRLFSSLRALTNSGRFQIVFGGERKMLEAVVDSHSPLYNFINPIPLGPLDRRAVEELVTRPMKQLEIELQDEAAIVQAIWEFTSGHPNIVQLLCHRLIVRLNERNARRVTVDDVKVIVADPGFQENDFLQTYWEQATPLERILTILAAQHGDALRLRDAVARLEGIGLRPAPPIVKAALDRLVDLRHILKHTQAGYEFAVEAFPAVLANTTTADDLLLVLSSDYLANPTEALP